MASASLGWKIGGRRKKEGRFQNGRIACTRARLEEDPVRSSFHKKRLA
jgi:hypothetical protein